MWNKLLTRLQRTKFIVIIDNLIFLKFTCMFIDVELNYVFNIREIISLLVLGLIVNLKYL